MYKHFMHKIWKSLNYKYLWIRYKFFMLGDSNRFLLPTPFIYSFISCFIPPIHTSKISKFKNWFTLPITSPMRRIPKLKYWMLPASNFYAHLSTIPSLSKFPAISAKFLFSPKLPMKTLSFIKHASSLVANQTPLEENDGKWSTNLGRLPCIHTSSNSSNNFLHWILTRIDLWRYSFYFHHRSILFFPQLIWFLICAVTKP